MVGHSHANKKMDQGLLPPGSVDWGFLQNPVVDRGLPKTNVGARLTKMSLQHMSLGGPEGPKTRISDHCGF